MTDTETLQHRVRQANNVIWILAEHGIRRFYSAAQDRRAKFGLDRHDQIMFVDALTGMLIYPFNGGGWIGFTEADRMRQLVERLAHYIKTGEPLATFFAALDGYSDDDMRKVREQVLGTDAVLRCDN